eukprot:TRINITY_DN11660_c0_g1_i1.p1 TRINITY_DN11660_c0_g1~~TRINITY_DN11660_c0_g1_i1.p1  ORF type:complete len:424 (+),score=98.43 TRINITY_DN11660_c0_g1_i1:51-1322(+)
MFPNVAALTELLCVGAGEALSPSALLTLVRMGDEQQLPLMGLVKVAAAVAGRAPSRCGSEGDASFERLQLLWGGALDDWVPQGLRCLRRATELAVEVAPRRADGRKAAQDAEDAGAEVELVFRSPRRARIAPTAEEGAAKPNSLGLAAYEAFTSYRPMQMAQKVMAGEALNLATPPGMALALAEEHGRLCIQEMASGAVKALVKSTVKAMNVLVQAKLLRHSAMKSKKHDKVMHTPRFVEDARTVDSQLRDLCGRAVWECEAELLAVMARKSAIEARWGTLSAEERAPAGELQAAAKPKKRKAPCRRTVSSSPPRMVPPAPSAASHTTHDLRSSSTKARAPVSLMPKRATTRTRSGTYVMNGARPGRNAGTSPQVWRRSVASESLPPPPLVKKGSTKKSPKQARRTKAAGDLSPVLAPAVQSP